MRSHQKADATRRRPDGPALPSPLPFVSVIVPVYEDRRLARCLEALAAQSYPRQSYEVVVVDNDASRRSVACGHANIRLYHEPQPGAYAARNLGIRMTRGELLAFTDADCIPDRHWLRAGVQQLMADDGPDILGGDVRLFTETPGRLTAAELWESLWGFPQQEYVELKHYAATANLFTHRRVFETVGPFNAELMSGGDREWGRRAHRCGRTLAFSATAFVNHPARRSLRELVIKYLRTCGGHYQLRLLAGEGHRKTVLKLLRRPWSRLFATSGPQSILQRFRYAGVELLLSTAQLLELLRLAGGGLPRRR